MASGGVLPLISRQYFPRNDQKCPYTQTQNTYIHSKTGKEYFNIIRKLLIQHKNLQNKILNIIFFFTFFWHILTSVSPYQPVSDPLCTKKPHPDFIMSHAINYLVIHSELLLWKLTKIIRMSPRETFIGILRIQGWNFTKKKERYH